VTAAPAFDLDADSRQALELSAVLDYAASFAATTMGRRRIGTRLPSTSWQSLTAEHLAVFEAVDYIGRLGRLLPARLPDAEPALAVLDVPGRLIEPVPLRNLAGALMAAASLSRQIRAHDDPGFAALKSRASAIPDLTPLAGDVAQHIAEDGSLEDGASAELRRIRQAIAKTGERLRRQLESFVHDPASASIVRDDFVTQRNGRFVIPVRADSPRPIEGIVHAASSSGQTLFVEPIESVALNNELVRLAEQEAAERERVLTGWTERFRDRRDEVVIALDGLAEIDTLQARALFAAEIRGCRPAISLGAPLLLSAARHPLLDRRLREHGGACVPVSLAIDPFDRVLVISGPNTGGKTVALKTAGLACLMAQCGLPVAAESATLPPFRQLRADIGDHQSIDADLSTFSAHVRAIARDLTDASPPALFLFDEIGTGTEPGEGAALAQAILEQVLTAGVTAIATTHHAALKAWAFDDPRVASAAMEFDAETLRPTYRVIAGAAGASAGIDIAARLGLPADVIARARALAGRSSLDAESYMERLRSATLDAESRAAELARREEALAAERAALSASAKEETERQRAEVRTSLAAAVDEIRKAGKRELAGIRDAKERAKAERAHALAEGRVRGLARQRQDAIAPPVADRPRTPFAPAPGVLVRILSLDREGTIVRVLRDRVEVRMGSTTFTVASSDVIAATGEAPVEKPVSKATSRLAALRSASRASASDEPQESTPVELHLLGQTVDEAIPALDRFLDASARDGRTEVRVVHGHGTGRLRQGVRRHLKGHPQVDGFRPGGDGEGGDGATVVTLK
jgi:DNA mismatch repair protein MutS2